MLSVIIPAYNEENRITTALEKLKKELSKYDEIIVVSEGQDNTASIAKSFGAHVLEFKNRLGKGGAVIEGIKSAKGEIIVLCDVDYGFQKNVCINDLISNIRDINIGSRYSSVKVQGSLKRKFFSRSLNLIIRILFGFNLNDTQCGFKAFRKEVLDKIIPHVKTKGFAFDIDVLWNAKKLGFKIKEMPIAWDYTEETKVNVIKTSIEIFKSIIKLRFGF
jgi:glycosyltransferase involved in cell wall biosynthesis